ncbi:Cytochrome P450 monooxygenase apdB [Trichinella spiralis]|uniref:Cytochrome P450 monooxygenase apdB n=1 Tax=Trichinella spiralis TaxID=6334 RepID=A0ABR3KV31_TRISP
MVVVVTFEKMLKRYFKRESSSQSVGRGLPDVISAAATSDRSDNDDRLTCRGRLFALRLKRPLEIISSPADLVGGGARPSAVIRPLSTSAGNY